jgi:hypothetical protein
LIEIPYIRHPTEFPVRYAYGPNSSRLPVAPCGTVHRYEWNDSRIFPGTTRRYWVHVPAQYDGSTPSSLTRI